MTKNDNSTEGEEICKACGLCCTGHFYSYTSLQSDEDPSAPNLALHVIKKTENPDKSVIPQPCPFWHEQCSIYNRSDKPLDCGSYQCKLLRDLQEGKISAEQALAFMMKTTRLINELEGKMPTGQNGSFVGRIIALIPQLEKEAPTGDRETGEMLLDIGILLACFSRYFGIVDIFNQQKHSEQPIAKVDSNNPQTPSISDQQP